VSQCIEKSRPWGDTRLNGVRMGQHKAAWIRTHGAVPEGLCVLHKCDNPLRVNVDHLFLGTQGDNVRDCIAKGRGNRPSGERQAKAKLTEEFAVYSMARMLVGEKQKDVASFFGVASSVMSRIWSGDSWKEAFQCPSICG